MRTAGSARWSRTIRLGQEDRWLRAIAAGCGGPVRFLEPAAADRGRLPVRSSNAWPFDDWRTETPRPADGAASAGLSLALTIALIAAAIIVMYMSLY